MHLTIYIRTYSLWTTLLLIACFISCHSKQNIINPDVQIELIAGNPLTPGYQDGLAKNAKFYSINSLIIDQKGDIYLTDGQSEVVRKITSENTVTTFAGRAPGNLFPFIGYQDGTSQSAEFLRPNGMAVDATGNFFLLDNMGHIRVITPDGQVSTLGGVQATNDMLFRDGPIQTAIFFQPSDLAFDSAGNLYVADCGNNCIRKITTDGQVSTFMGKPRTYGHKDGSHDSATFHAPYQIVFDHNDNLFVADLYDGSIRKITPSGSVTTLAGGGADGTTQGYKDGIGKVALFGSFISDLAVDASGNLYLGDPANERIRKITPDGLVSTIVDQIPFYSLTNSRVAGLINTLAFDKADNLYAADNYAVYKVNTK